MCIASDSNTDFILVMLSQGGLITELSSISFPVTTKKKRIAMRNLTLDLSLISQIVSGLC